MTSSNDVVTLTVTMLLMTQVRVMTSVFQSSSGIPSEFHIVEEMPAGTLVGSARDNPQLLQMDNNNTYSLRFAIRQGPALALAGEHFAVDEQSGDIKTRKPIDREQVCLPGTSSCSIVFDVVVIPLKYFQIVRVIVHVDDINDNTPTFPQQQLTLRIKESSLPGSAFPLPVATDADSGAFGIQGFELTSSSVGLFGLEVTRNVDESFDVRLKLTGKLDRESVSRHQLTVVAFDGGRPRRSGTVVIDIIVTDANDHSPHFASSNYEVEIVENELPTTAIVRVEATDADEGQNSRLVYRLDEFSQIEYGDAFRVDPVTGEVFLRRRLDREHQSLYRLTVTAADGGSPTLSAFTRLIVKVLDDNDNAPRVVVSSTSADKELRVAENSEPRTFTAYISASDDDLGSAGKVDCYVEGRQFRLEPLYGGTESEYKLLTATTFDRELRPTVLVTLTCSDRGYPRSRSVTVELTVEVSDENDNAPVIASEKYEVEMAEGNDVGAEVVRINATDADAGHNAELRFFMTPVGRTPDQDLSIDERTGSVTADVRLNFETCSLYEYTVSVSDLGDVARTSTASLVVRVTDTDDERPQFQRPAYYFDVLEDVPVGTVVGRVVATDKDLTSPFSAVSYHIRGDGTPFSIDGETGELRTVRQLDRERESVWELSVVAKDSSPVETSVSVTVAVQDVNDNAPVIVSPPPAHTDQLNRALVVVPTRLPARSVLTRVEAHDADEGENARVTYSLDHGDQGRLFDVDPLTGVVTTTRLLPSPPAAEYRLVITARDHGQPAKMTVLDLIVVVNDTAAATHSAFTSSSLADSSLLSDHRFLVVFAVICSVVVVLLLALLVCTVLVVRRTTAKPSHLKPSSAPPACQQPLTDNCVTSAADWGDEYTRMINEIRVKTPSTGSVVSSASRSASKSASSRSSSVLASTDGRRCSHCSRRSVRRDGDDVIDAADIPPATSPSTSSSLTSSSVTSSGRRVTSSRARSRDTAKASSLSSVSTDHRSETQVGAESGSECSRDLSCRDSGLVLHDACRHQRHHNGQGYDDGKTRHHRHQAADTQNV